jgi:hypothetical protein
MTNEAGQRWGEIAGHNGGYVLVKGRPVVGSGMGELVMIRNTAGRGSGLPALVARAGKGARTRFLEFFTVNIRNPNSRAASRRSRLSPLVRSERDWRT